ncbi:hypothetical protein Tco_1116628, partial [Tanacetum coccineum]
RTVDYGKLERKLNETLGLLAQKEIDIKEGLKVKAYEISVVKEKHDELVKQSLLTKSHYEGLVKEKTKVITDLKHKEEKDIDKMISMEKQLKFLNKIVYKRNQSIQTINMLAPKGPTFNGRPTFANPMYLKKAQSKIPCLYVIPNDQSDPVNRLVPDREDTLTLERESRSKLNKDLVRPYDYTKLNREAKKKAKLQKDKALNTKPSVQQSTRLPNTANGNKPDPRNFNQQPRNTTVNIAEPPRNRIELSHREKVSPNKSSAVYLKTTPLRSGLTWKPTGRIFTQVGLKWIPIRKSVETRYNTNDSVSPLGKKTHNPNTTICANSSSLSAGTSMASEPISSKGSSNVQTMVLQPHSRRVRFITTCSCSNYKDILKHQDSRIKKAQELKIKTSANSDIKYPSPETKLQGRFLASFQDDAKYEHVGQDTRSQGDKDEQGKYLKISESKTKLKGNDKG